MGILVFDLSFVKISSQMEVADWVANLHICLNFARFVFQPTGIFSMGILAFEEISSQLEVADWDANLQILFGFCRVICTQGGIKHFTSWELMLSAKNFARNSGIQMRQKS